MPEAETDETDRAQHLRLIEALLFASAAPLDEAAIAERLPDGADVPALLARAARRLSRAAASIWCSSPAAGPSAPRADLADRAAARKGRCRANCRGPAIETLAIIAYHQPVTRAEIEDIRGVAVSRARSTC